MSDKTIVNWYDLKDYEILYINKDVMKDLINKGTEKAGSLSKLMLELNSGHVYNILKNNRGFSVKNLRKLLEFLGLDYAFLNEKITEVRKGKKCSIGNPKFPINLLNPKMGGLSGHLVSDGCLYYDKSRENLIRTKYCSDEREAICMFIENLKDVFGDVHFNEEFERNCIQIKVGNGIVGEAFKRAGVTVGKKYKLNNGLPWVVEEGSRELKRAYLSAIFDDEGSVGKNPRPYLILSRNIHVNLEEGESNLLDKHISPLMKSSFFPTGHLTRVISIRKVKHILNEIKAGNLLEKLLVSKPKILLGESDLLRDCFGINNHTYVISLHLTNNGYYSMQSALVIRNKKEVIKFNKEIGFSLTKKQKKLKEALMERGWLYGA